MYIQLEVGWMRHPFPINSFRIASDTQLHTVKALGLEAVRYFPDRSDPEVVAPVETAGDAAGEEASPPAAHAASAPLPPSATGRPQVLSAQLWQRCNERFRAAAREYTHLQACAATQPQQALAQGRGLVEGYIEEVLPGGDLVIRLLSEGSGNRQADHPVNVTVLSLLLGKVLGLSAGGLYELGMAALLHDIGKEDKPGGRPPDEEYERHVGDSVALASGMGVSSDVLTAMAQHHEFADGSGFPLHLIDEDLSTAGKILCLANSYDRLCNPEFAQEGQTPHEALAMLYAQFRERFDPAILRAFIRMMGVYPPGSVVQLADGRFAMVVSVNSSRPLKPQVLVYDVQVPVTQARPLDLETSPDIGIRRSLRPDQLPREALSYLSPRQRICYFFERAVEPCAPEGSAP